MSTDGMRAYTQVGATTRRSYATTKRLPEADVTTVVPSHDEQQLPATRVLTAHGSTGPAPLPPPTLAPPNPSTRTDAYPVARWVFGGVAAIAFLAVAAQLLVVATGSLDFAEAVNFLGLLSVPAAIIGGVVCAMLAANPIRQSGAFTAVRMAALLMAVGSLAIMLMGVPAFYTPTSSQLVVDALLDVVVPVLVLGSWLFFGPRPRFAFNQIAAAVVIPVVWLVYALVHGAITGFYAYSYLNVAAVGLGMVAFNSAFLLFLAVAICIALVSLDRLLPWAPRV